MTATLRTYILIIMLTFVGMLKAMPAVVIEGRVYDSSNRPIEFATVRIAGTTTGTHTNERGQYRLSLSSVADTIKIVFSCTGYCEASRTLISPSGNVKLNMRLYASPAVLKQIEVTDFKRQTGAMQSVATTDYRQQAADPTGGSVESLLATLPGVNQGDELSSQKYSVRGGSYDENSVYINGIEIYRPQLMATGQQEGLSIINADMVDRVEFSTGGYGAQYSDRMSSVLDITYRQPVGFQASASASLMGASLAVGQGSSRFSQLHGLRYKRNNSLLSTLDIKGEYDPRFFDYQFNINARICNRLTTSVLGNIAVNSYRFTPVDRNTAFGTATDPRNFKVYFDGHEHDKFVTWIGALALRYRHSRSSSTAIVMSAFRSDELVAYDITGEYWLTHDSDDSDESPFGIGRYHEHARNRMKSTVMSLALQSNTVAGINNLSYGIDFKHQKVDEQSREWAFTDSAGYMQPPTFSGLKMTHSLTSNNSLNTTRMSAYIIDGCMWNTASGFFRLNAGIRASWFEFNREFLLSPRANASYVPHGNSRWTLRAATGLYYQSPFYKELRLEITDKSGNSSVQLNNDIKSPRSIHVIAGADFTFAAFNRLFKLTGEAYYKSLSRIIPYQIDNLKITYAGINASSGHSAGIDLKLFGQFVKGSDSWLSVSLMSTIQKINGIKIPLPTDRRYSMAMFFTDYFPRLPRLTFSLRGILADGLPVWPPHSEIGKNYFRTPSYRRVDIGLNYAIIAPVADDAERAPKTRTIKSMWVGIDCFNLFDMTNTGSYYWINDVDGVQYGVPNYLTRRQLNVKLSISF